ncbi:MAG: hypothetical protein ACREK2_05475 [Gemmatimonadota bacterium]
MSALAAFVAHVLFALAFFSPGAFAQGIRPVSLDSLSALGLDSVGQIATAYFRSDDRARALQLQSLLDEYLTFYRERMDIESRMRIAVLDPPDWEQLTNVPYGLPNNSGPPYNILLGATVPPARVGARALPAGRLGDLLTVGHEGGHLLMWELLPPDLGAAMSDSGPVPPDAMERFARIGQVPVWYWEMTANYFTTAFLEATHPDDARAWEDHLREISSIERPRFTHLGDWFGAVLLAVAPDSTPYVFSTEGGLNQGWYQGVVGLVAVHIHEQAGFQFLDHLREILTGTVAPSTQELVERLDSIAPGTIELLEELGAGYTDETARSGTDPP